MNLFQRLGIVPPPIRPPVRTPAPAPPTGSKGSEAEPSRWYYRVPDAGGRRPHRGSVVAHTKSEARSLIKITLGGLKRLPVGSVVGRAPKIERD